VKVLSGYAGVIFGVADACFYVSFGGKFAGRFASKFAGRFAGCCCGLMGEELAV